MQGFALTNRLRSGVRLFLLVGVATLVAALLLEYGASSPGENAPRMTTTSTPAALLRTDVPARLRPSVTTAMRDHRCSAQPGTATSQAWSALVIVDDSVRHVSQDEGWAVYTGTRPGRFIALCRGAVRRTR